MEYVDATAIPPSAFTLSSSDQEANYYKNHNRNDEENENNNATHLQANYSSPSSFLTRSPSSPSGSGSGSGSESGDRFTLEPDLQMSRANWWQVLVTIYHPNPEIGTKLVMGDIMHL